MGVWEGNQMAGMDSRGLQPRPAGTIMVADDVAMQRVLRLSAQGHSPRLAEERFVAPPCFFHRDCGGTSEVEKQGKSVCGPCARGMNGAEYSLRKPGREPLYSKVEELVLQLEMKEGRRKRSGE
jgi:hypothetical protein